MTDDLLRAREVLAADYSATGGTAGPFKARDILNGVLSPDDERAIRCISLAFATPRPVETGEVIQADRDAAARTVLAQAYRDAGFDDAADGLSKNGHPGWVTVEIAEAAIRLAFASPTPEPDRRCTCFAVSAGDCACGAWDAGSASS